MGEHRRNAKRVRFSTGFNMRIVGRDGSWQRRCTMLDVSDSGARLQVDGSLDGLDLKDFILLLSAIGSAHRRCDLVWRDGNYIGVRFLHRESAVRQAATSNAS